MLFLIKPLATMLGIFGRKKLGEDQLAQIFVNAMINMAQEAFPDVADMINDEPSFIECPELNHDGYIPFLFVIISGNLKYLPKQLNGDHSGEVLEKIYEQLAEKFDTTAEGIEQHIKKYQSELNRLNHPSKNTLYGMSKLFFHLYDLYPFQDDYYTRIQAQNPIVLKRIDAVMNAFLWDWEVINEEYKIVS
jgi:hypothetical protein